VQLTTLPAMTIEAFAEILKDTDARK
jgi:hypothetical protein